MTSFIINHHEMLPYKENEYLEYLYDETEFIKDWFGVSIQCDNKESKQIVLLKQAFSSLTNSYDTGRNWTIKHCGIHCPWFMPSKKAAKETLPDLRAFFKSIELI